MRKTEVQRPRGFPSRPTRDGNLSRKTLTRSEWWPQRDSNPSSHIAARFCQRINDLRRVESTTTAGGRKPSRPLVAGGMPSSSPRNLCRETRGSRQGGVTVDSDHGGHRLLSACDRFSAFPRG